MTLTPEQIIDIITRRLTKLVNESSEWPIGSDEFSKIAQRVDELTETLSEILALKETEK